MSDSVQAQSDSYEVPSDEVLSYLRQPYARMVIPEGDGSYRGEILEFPGCIASGMSAADTLTDLEDAARGWLTAAIAQKQPIPRPVEAGGFSGKLVVRLPKSLHKKASRVAERDGVSLNQYIVYSVAEHVGERLAPVSQSLFGFVLTAPLRPATTGLAGSRHAWPSNSVFGRSGLINHILNTAGDIDA